MDLLAGAISSEPWRDLERVWRFEDAEPGFSPSLMDLSRSDSDSDDKPDEDEFDDNPLVPRAKPRFPTVFLPLFGAPNGVPMSEESIPTA